MAITYQDFLPLKNQGDPVADKVVTRLLDEGRVNSVNELFRQITTADQAVPEDCPAVLREYFESTRTFPEEMAPENLADTAAFFHRYKAEAAALQATAGLVGTYLSPIGAKTLHSTHKLDQPHRRLSQSTRLFMGMADDDAFTEHSKLIPICQKVRLVHSAIRQLHLRSGKWDTEHDGMPVSQYYTGGAALVFSVGITDAMSRLGLHVSEQEEYGFLLAWAIVAHFLGVPDEMIPRDPKNARDLWNSARESEWERSDAGVILTAECIKLYESYMPPGMEGAVPAFLRQALSDKYADMVEVPRSAYDLGAKAASAATEFLNSTPLGNNAPVNTVFGVLSQAVEKVARDAFTHGQETEPQMADRIG